MSRGSGRQSRGEGESGGESGRRRDPRDEPEDRTRLVLWIVLGVMCVGLFCVVVPVGIVALDTVRRSAEKRAREKEKPGVAPAPPAGRADFGQADVEFVNAFVTSSISGTRFGQFEPRGQLLMIKFRVRNTSPNKLMVFRGWHDVTRVQDEHGNEYGPIDFGAGWKFNSWESKDSGDEGLDSANAVIARNHTIHPGKGIVTYLFQTMPIDQAEKVIFTVDAAATGGVGSSENRTADLAPGKEVGHTCGSPNAQFTALPIAPPANPK